jgi:hypothetical protein
VHSLLFFGITKKEIIMKFKLSALILALSCFHANAEMFTSLSNDEFISTDVYAEGDNLATLHYETGLEWLDLTETDGMSINDANDALNGRLAGWRLPTNEEVETLITSFFAGYDYTQSTYATVRESGATNPMFAYNRIFGEGGSYSYGNYTVGKYYDESNIIRIAGGYINGSSYSVLYGIDSQYSYTPTSPTYGVYLVSDGGVTRSSKLDPTLNSNNPNAPIGDVPAMAMGGLGILALGLRRRAKQK